MANDEARSPENGQYTTDRFLSARMRMHREYSTNRYGWFRWLLDRLALTRGDRILDVGCGNGTFWRVVADHVPADCTLLMTDKSPGMIEQAAVALSETNLDVRFATMDAESLDCASESRTLVLASHMLYHVANRQRAISEIRRVLVGGGRLVAATNGMRHMQQLDAMAKRFLSQFDPGSEVERFSLESGLAQLEAHFDAIDRFDYKDGFVVPDADTVFNYIMSLPDAQRAPKAEVNALREHLDHTVDADHPMVIDKASGAFVCM